MTLFGDPYHRNMFSLDCSVIFSSLIIMAAKVRAGRDEALHAGVPSVSLTDWHGQRYGELQIRGNEQDDRILVVGTPGFDDSYCAFEVTHPRSVRYVGGLTLCRCDQILYNKGSPKISFDDPLPVEWQATNSKAFKDQAWWIDTSLVYIESTLCKPGPCCHENVTKTPDLPAGMTPNYRRKFSETSTATLATEFTEQPAVRNEQGLGAGATAGIAVGAVVAAACIGGGIYWFWKKKGIPRKISGASKTEKETA